MFARTLAIARNTFFESVRQPVMLVMLVAATLAIILSNPLSAFTMGDDQRMLIDIGLSTIFVCGAILASFIATSVLGREIENRTALTVISKPVSRPVFVIGKFFGVAAAMTLGVAYMSMVFLLVQQQGVLQTVREPINMPVVTFGIAAAAIGLGVAVWCNYFYNKVFASTVICVTTPLAALAYVFSLMFNTDFSWRPMSAAYRPELMIALVALLIAILVLTAIAVAASTRLGQVMTLTVTVIIFMAGLLSDWFIGGGMATLEARWLERARLQGHTSVVTHTRTYEYIDDLPQTVKVNETVSSVPLWRMADGNERLHYVGLKIGYSIVPNFQVLWLSDALTQGRRISTGYLIGTSIYGLLQIGAALGIAIALFQGREVG